MSETATVPTNHDAPADAFAVPPPLVATPPAPRRTAAEEARTLVANNTLGSLATLSEGDHPWASVVAYATIGQGTPVLMVSTLAEHGRNLLRDPRASLVIADPVPEGADALDSGRVTLAGRCERPVGEEALEAREAYIAAVPVAESYADYGDFSIWVLRIDRVRWVGGYGRMDSADAASYIAAEPDPVAPLARRAISHLNDDHAEQMLLVAQRLAGYTDATAARCERADRYGLDLTVTTPRGTAPTRVAFAEPCTTPDGLHKATIELVRRARES